MSFYVMPGTTIRSRGVDLKESTIIRDNTQVQLSYRAIFADVIVYILVINIRLALRRHHVR